MRPILLRHLQRNEFLGRINEIVYFLPFSEDELKQLVQMELQKWKEKAKNRNGIDLNWNDDVVNTVIKGYDLNYGARSLKFEIDRFCINQIASLWEQGAIVSGSRVTMYMEG